MGREHGEKKKESSRPEFCALNGLLGLDSLQTRLETAVMAAKETTTAMRSKFKIPDFFQEMAVAAAKCRDPVSRKVLRKRAQRARKEFEGRKIDRRKLIEKLWIDGRVSEDGDMWMKGVMAHCEHCYDDN